MSRRFFGIILVLLGLLLILDILGISEFKSTVSVWWPVILIAIGVADFFKREKSRFVSSMFIIIGAILLFRNLDFIPGQYLRLVWPIILILIGLTFALPRRTLVGSFARIAGELNTVNDDKLSYFTAFSGIEARVLSDNFRGGYITAIFGGADVDLRHASISPDGAYMFLGAAFGGVTLKVPEDWKVIVTGIPLFGGWENKAKVNESNMRSEHVLKIRCFAMFGGVDITN